MSEAKALDRRSHDFRQLLLESPASLFLIPLLQTPSHIIIHKRASDSSASKRHVRTQLSRIDQVHVSCTQHFRCGLHAGPLICVKVGAAYGDIEVAMTVDFHTDGTREARLWRRLHYMGRELTLRIIIEQPPPGVDFGLQKGSGSVYETVQKQRSQGKDLVFEFQPSIRAGVSDSMAALSGPFVQGPRRQRFIYLDIGTCAGQSDSCWSRRLKVPLDGIPPKFIALGGVLEGRVAGTGRDGGPNCATVKDFEGWMPARSKPIR